jgi:hypothetical protein
MDRTMGTEYTRSDASPLPDMIHNFCAGEKSGALQFPAWTREAKTLAYKTNTIGIQGGFLSVTPGGLEHYNAIYPDPATRPTIGTPPTDPAPLEGDEVTQTKQQLYTLRKGRFNTYKQDENKIITVLLRSLSATAREALDHDITGFSSVTIASIFNHVRAQYGATAETAVTNNFIARTKSHLTADSPDIVTELGEFDQAFSALDRRQESVGPIEKFTRLIEFVSTNASMVSACDIYFQRAGNEDATDYAELFRELSTRAASQQAHTPKEHHNSHHAHAATAPDKTSSTASPHGDLSAMIQSEIAKAFAVNAQTPAPAPRTASGPGRSWSYCAVHGVGGHTGLQCFVNRNEGLTIPVPQPTPATNGRQQPTCKMVQGLQQSNIEGYRRVVARTPTDNGSWEKRGWDARDPARRR